MLTQIYEVSTSEEAEAACAIGIDHVGILVGDGTFPREQPVAAAARIAAAVRRPARVSALFLTAELALIELWANRLRPEIVHLGAAPDLLTAEDVTNLRPRLPDCLIMRSVPVTDASSLALARTYDGLVNYLLLDSHRPSDRQIGALGVTHDWTISRQIVEAVATPVILAGGLGPANAADAIRAVRPAGVDSKTRTDRDGSHAKDLDRVRAFHAAAKAHA